MNLDSGLWGRSRCSPVFVGIGTSDLDRRWQGGGLNGYVRGASTLHVPRARAGRRARMVKARISFSKRMEGRRKRQGRPSGTGG